MFKNVQLGKCMSLNEDNLEKLVVHLLIYKNQCLSVGLSRIGAHTVHPIAMKLPQVVVNIPGVVLEI